MKPRTKLYWDLKKNEVLKNGFYIWGIFWDLSSLGEWTLISDLLLTTRKEAKDELKKLLLDFESIGLGKSFKIRKVFVNDRGKRNEC